MYVTDRGRVEGDFRTLIGQSCKALPGPGRSVPCCLRITLGHPSPVIKLSTSPLLRRRLCDRASLANNPSNVCMSTLTATHRQTSFSPIDFACRAPIFLPLNNDGMCQSDGKAWGRLYGYWSEPLDRLAKHSLGFLRFHDLHQVGCTLVKEEEYNNVCCPPTIKLQIDVSNKCPTKRSLMSLLLSSILLLLLLFFCYNYCYYYFPRRV